jgi:hypothetical protein
MPYLSAKEKLSEEVGELCMQHIRSALYDVERILSKEEYETFVQSLLIYLRR